MCFEFQIVSFNFIRETSQGEEKLFYNDCSIITIYSLSFNPLVTHRSKIIHRECYQILSTSHFSTCDFDLRSTRQLTRTMDSINENIPISIFFPKCRLRSGYNSPHIFDGAQNGVTMFQLRLA